MYEASQVLTSIDDPVMIPFLEELLGCSPIARTAAVAQLGKLRTPAAVTALLGAAGSDDDELAELAQHVLGSLLRAEGAALATEVRRRIEDALQERSVDISPL